MHALTDAYKHALKTDILAGRIDGLFLRGSLFQSMFIDAATSGNTLSYLQVKVA